MTEKTSTPEDSIHNLRLVIEALEAEGVGRHVSFVEDGIAQIERLRAQVSKLTDELDRTLRNRDMWKSQCERQADQLRKSFLLRRLSRDWL